MKRRFATLFLAMAMILTMLPMTAAQAASVVTIDGNIMKNDYIAVDAAGNYSIGTSDGKILLYGYPDGGTSYATVWVDENYARFDNLTLSNNQFDLATGTFSRVGIYGGIEVTQSFRIVPSPATGHEDLVEIKYTARNTTDQPHDVGHRTMLDTKIDGNDDAPFRIGGEAFTTGREYEGDSIPYTWQALDGIANPSLVAYARLRGTGNDPDTVQFGNWGDMSRTPWGYVVNPELENGDSAVCVIWEPKSLAPGETRSFVTYYGLGDASSSAGETLALTVTGDAEAVVSGQGYAPYVITAIVENTGSESAENVYVTLSLPEGMSLAPGEMLTRELGTIAARASGQAAWNVVFDQQSRETRLTYSVEAGINGVADTNRARNVTVPPLTNRLIAIAISSPPDIMNYFIGGEGPVEPYLDLSGMQVTAYYSDGSSRLLEDNEWTTDLADGSALVLDSDGDNLIPPSASLIPRMTKRQQQASAWASGI